MPEIKLPDGTIKQFDQPVSIADVAADIGPGLAKAALAGKANGQLLDTSRVLDVDTDLSIVTDKDEDGLEIIRHSTAHLLAHAVKELFEDVQVTIGPTIENGFYYDFAYAPGFSIDDLPKIEERMHEIAKRAYSVSREEISRNDAVTFFRDMGEEYKAKIIEDIPEDETLTIYKQGDFVDLCRGPHVPNTGMLKAFKLTKVSGAYWRGDSSNEMLQRIYGTAWADKKALKNYLQQIEEAEKRDHRKIAKKMDLFHVQEEAPGMVFWHPNGWIVRRIVEQYIRKKTNEYNYQEINTPIMLDQHLWEKSGHMAKYSSEMFLTESEHHNFAIKPMSCPGAIQVFNQGIKSYRDLPLRLSEFGCCHRNEPSGTLHGLMRVRHFTQDDAHIFVTENQIQDEVSRFIDQVFAVYKDFGFDDVIVRLSTRPEQRVGADALWDKAENALEQALNGKKLEWQLQEGDGAFYGPKIDFSLRDCIGRVWQCGTMQLDFSMPTRLGAHYIDDEGNKKVPVMLHRAMLGSMERFIGILIENYAGVFPLWLAPVQVVVMNITDDQAEYAKSVVDQMKKAGQRAHADLRNEKIGFKIREHTIKRVPYLIVVGQNEKNDQKISVRTQGGEDLGVMTLQNFMNKLQSDADVIIDLEE